MKINWIASFTGVCMSSVSKYEHLYSPRMVGELKERKI